MTSSSEKQTPDSDNPMGTPRWDELRGKLPVSYGPPEGRLYEKLGMVIQFANQLEHELASAERRITDMAGALGQASFCLRELLPNDEDAQMTVRIIDRALQEKQP